MSPSLTDRPAPNHAVPGLRRWDWRSTLALCVLLLAARAVLLASLADVFFAGEEQSHGTVAKLVLDGLELPIPRLIYQPYEGGGLFASLVTAPVFHWIGPSLLAQKLVAELFDLANLVLGCLLCARWFGTRAQWFFGLCYVFGPAACQQTALLNVGNHFAVLAPFFLLAHLGLLVSTRPRGGEPGRALLFGLGALGGFGCWFDFMTGALVAFLAACLLLVPPRLARVAQWGWLSAGALVGALPFAWVFAYFGKRVLEIHGRPLGETFGGTPTSTAPGGWFAELVREMTPSSFVQVTLLVALPFVGAIAWWVRRERDDRRERDAYTFVFAFLLFLTVVSLLSSFRATYFQHYSALMRYMPHWGLAALLTALALERVARCGARGKLGAWAVLLASAALGAWQTLELARAGQATSTRQAFALLRSFKGYEYAEYLPKLYANLGEDRAAFLKLVASIDEGARDDLYPAAVQALRASGRIGFEDLVRLARAADPEHWTDFLAGAGPHIVENGDLGRALAEINARVPSGPLRDAWFEAVGRYGRGNYPLKRNWSSEADFYARAGAPPGVWRGLGWRIHQTHRLDPDVGQGAILELPEGVRTYVAEGFARALRANHLDAAPRE